MSIKIDWQKYPPQKNAGDDEEPHYFPRTKDSRLITDEELFARMSLHSGKHRSYYMPALEDLSQAIAETLLEGNIVKLSDLGTFSLGLGTHDAVTESNFTEMENILINGVKFTPSENLLQRLQHPEFKWSPERATHPQLDDEQIVQYLEDWFITHDTITRQEFCNLLQMSRTTGTNWLNKLIDKKVVRKIGHNRDTRYVLTTK